MAVSYVSLDDVLAGVKRGVFANESTFRQAFVEALKNEARRYCTEVVYERVLRVILDKIVRGRMPDVVFANVVMELEAPPSNDKPVSRRKVEEQLKKYMEKMAEPHLSVTVWGLATNGWRAELWVLKKIPLNGDVEMRIELVIDGPMPDVTRHLLRIICSEKIQIVSPKDLVVIFGV